MQQSRASTAELLRQGFTALEEGRPKDAAALCKAAIAKEPKRTEAHFLVGLVALDLEDLKTAARAFGSVVKLDPNHAAGWAQLARLFMRMGQPARAEKALLETKRAGVKEAPVADLLGVVASLLGDQKEARRWYGVATTMAPERADYAVNLATASIFLGDTDKARTILESVLARDDRIGQAQWLYSSIAKATDIRRAEMLTERANEADAQSAAFLAYAAGKEFEDCGQWEKAFAAFDVGARAKRRLVAYDEPAETDFFAALHEVVDSTFSRRSVDGAADPSPIFVVGQPRTGTTLIERIITSHSRIESAGELQQFGLSARRLMRDPSPERHTAQNVWQWPDIDPKALGEEYLRVSAVMRSGAPRFVDKLPGNYLYIPLILAALPKAKIVHLTRDPMDSCFASFKQLFADAYFHSYEQGEMARHFGRYHRLMDHWRRLYEGRFFDVSYEAVASDLEPEARRLIDFLELPWEDACLAFHAHHGAVATASAAQVREPVHTRSVGRWRRYERELEPMRKALAAEGIAVSG